MSRSLRAVAVEGLAWGVGAKGLLLVSNMAVLMVTSRLLTPADFGVFAAALIVTDLAYALAMSWIGVPLVQQADLTADERNAAFYLALGLGAVLAVASAGASYPLALLLGNEQARPVLCALAVFLPFKLVSAYFGACLQRDLDLRYYQISQNLPQLLSGGLLTMTGAWLGWGVWALVAGMAGATLIEFSMVVLRKRPPIHAVRSAAVYRRLARRGAAPALHRMMEFASANLDRAVTGALLGAAALGMYTRANNLLMVPVKLIGLPLDRTLFPVFSKRQGDRRMLGQSLQDIVSIQLLIYLPVGIGMALSAPYLVALVLGPQWTALVPAAQCLFLVLFARLGYINTEAASLAVGEARYALGRQSAQAGAVLVGAWVGARQHGVTGVAIGVGCAIVLFYLVSLASAVKRFGCSAEVLLWAHLRAAMVAVIGLAAALLCDAASGHVAANAWPSPTGQAIVAYWCAVSAAWCLGPGGLVGRAFATLRQASRHRIMRG